MQNTLHIATSTAIVFMLIFGSCNNKAINESALESSKEHEFEMASIATSQGTNDVPNFKNVSSATQQHVNNLIRQYDMMKNALVLSDFAKTNQVTKGFIEEIISFNNKKELKDEQAGFYLKVGAKLKNNAERIQKSKSLEEQRIHFSSLTADLFKILKAFGGNEENVYYQFCPMAFDNTGGFWLSLNKQIENPYFGDKMLKCGVVRETIK